MDARAHFVIEKLGEALMTAETIINEQQQEIEELKKQLEDTGKGEEKAKLPTDNQTP